MVHKFSKLSVSHNWKYLKETWKQKAIFNQISTVAPVSVSLFCYLRWTFLIIDSSQKLSLALLSKTIFLFIIDTIFTVSKQRSHYEHYMPRVRTVSLCFLGLYISHAWKTCIIEQISIYHICCALLLLPSFFVVQVSLLLNTLCIF